jgi:hypothetical protein
MAQLGRPPKPKPICPWCLERPVLRPWRTKHCSGSCAASARYHREGPQHVSRMGSLGAESRRKAYAERVRAEIEALIPPEAVSLTRREVIVVGLKMRALGYDRGWKVAYKKFGPRPKFRKAA